MLESRDAAASKALLICASAASNLCIREPPVHLGQKRLHWHLPPPQTRGSALEKAGREILFSFPELLSRKRRVNDTRLERQNRPF